MQSVARETKTVLIVFFFFLDFVYYLSCYVGDWEAWLFKFLLERKAICCTTWEIVCETDVKAEGVHTNV